MPGQTELREPRARSLEPGMVLGCCRAPQAKMSFGRHRTGARRVRPVVASRRTTPGVTACSDLRSAGFFRARAIAPRKSLSAKTQRPSGGEARQRPHAAPVRRRPKDIFARVTRAKVLACVLSCGAKRARL